MIERQHVLLTRLGHNNISEKIRIFLIFYSITILSFGCSSKKKIEITTEYIINENWNKIASSVQICRMKLKNDSTFLVNKQITQADILNKLEIDSTFIYNANFQTKNRSFKGEKVYFNVDNGFSWGSENSDSTKVVIGNLERGKWYKFSYLVTYPLYVYVFVDESGKVNSFQVNLSNY
jgi:hypothetical protein